MAAASHTQVARISTWALRPGLAQPRLAHLHGAWLAPALPMPGRPTPPGDPASLLSTHIPSVSQGGLVPGRHTEISRRLLTTALTLPLDPESCLSLGRELLHGGATFSVSLLSPMPQTTTSSSTLRGPQNPRPRRPNHAAHRPCPRSEPWEPAEADAHQGV